MAEPVSVATAVGWGVKAVGWIVSPVLSNVIKDAYGYLKLDAKDKLDLLDMKIVQLELMLSQGETEIITRKRTLDPMLENLKTAFYEADEFLDLLEYHRLEKQVQSISSSKANVVKRVQKQASGSKSNDMPPGLSKKKLKKTLDKIECIINEAHRTLEVLNWPQTSLDKKSEPSSVNLRTTGIPKTKIIGRDAECDRIVAMLHDPEGCSVMGIHGIAGSGKTTLAQAIFAREQLTDHFHICIWLHVSQDFDIENINKDLILAVTGEGSTQVNLNEFEQILMERLHEKRYLLVLDDVWYQPRDINSSEKLLRILPPKTAGKTGSKLLVTSRSAEAALVFGAVKKSCFKISDLDEVSFHELLMHHALGNSSLVERELSEFQELGARIAMKLKRSPLSARAVGAQLYMRQSIDFWRRAESRNLLDDLVGALLWSYLHLPVPVRRCFAFCAVFPRRRVIYRDQVIQMWIAAGVLRGTHEDDLESLANDYFEDLVSVSFLQPGVIGKWELQNYYVVHNSVHDLAVQVAGNDVFTITYGWKGKVPDNTRHLFVQNSYLDMGQMASSLKGLRTLILGSHQIEVNDNILSALPMLRVLRIPIRGLPRMQPSCSTYIIRLPESIVKLKHLRYLSFTGEIRNAEIRFPRKFAKVYHLEVLEFECKISVVFNWGKDNVCFSNLRHLISKGPLDVPHIGRASSLQTLNYCTVKDEEGFDINQLHGLNNLHGRMKIVGLECLRSKEEAVQANLSRKIHLKHLILEWGPREVAQADIDVATEVLYALCPPPNLERLEIFHYSGLPYPQWLVNGHMKRLQVLCFTNSIHSGPPPDLSSLTHLETLDIKMCEWNALPSNMCCLTKLTSLAICWCPNVLELPVLPNTIEIFTLWACNKLFMESCEEVGHPNCENIAHIPYKVISMGPGRGRYPELRKFMRTIQ